MNNTTEQPHLLQTPAWGQLKSQFGWTVQHLNHNNSQVQILFRQLPLGLSIAYIPKGPAIDWQNSSQGQALFSAIHTEAHKRRAIFLKVEPDLEEASYPPPSEQIEAARAFFSANNFSPADSIQPQSSIVIDISGTDEAIMAVMKQKTRYNIRLARRKGVIIQHGTETDIPTFHQLAQLTAKRDGFGVHSLAYYQTAFKLFAPHHCTLLIAKFEGVPLAALMVFSHHKSAYYFYGASSNTHRNLMPTYLIQWEAMQWAKQQGCTQYDLWGIPTADRETLEAEFTQRHDGLWGVYRFKRGFGGYIVKSMGAFDYVYNPLLYKLYKLRRNV